MVHPDAVQSVQTNRQTPRSMSVPTRFVEARSSHCLQDRHPFNREPQTDTEALSVWSCSLPCLSHPGVIRWAISRRLFVQQAIVNKL